MRKSAAALIALTIIIVLAFALTRSTSSAVRESCGCSAPDGSCSASGSCTGKCTAQCPSGGCNVSCSGFGFLGTEVSMQMRGGTSPKLLNELARRTGKSMSYTAGRPEGPFNLSARRSSVWDLLELLSNNGTVTVEGEDFENLKTTRQAMMNGERLSLAVHGLTAAEYVAHLAALSGQRLYIKAGDANAMVNFNVENVTLEEILQKVSEETGVQIVNADDEWGGR